MHDYIVIGAGIIGAFVSNKLSKYDLKVLVLDKENDICNETSKANSAIIHSGYDPIPGTLKAKLNVKGNKMYRGLCEYYNIPFYNIGSLTLAFDDKEVDQLKELVRRSEINNVLVSLISGEEVLKIEPNVNENIKMALLAPTTGVVYPWHMAMALFDHSISNGVKLKLNQEVISIEKIEDYFLVKTKDEEYKTKNIVNCAGVHGAKIAEKIGDKNYKITPKKGEYLVVERGAKKYINHILFPLPSEKGKGILAIPISDREILFGPTSKEKENYDDVSTSFDGLNEIRENLKRTLKDIPLNRVMSSFSGLRAASAGGDFIIEESENTKGVYHIIGIESPGFASAPAIAEYFSEIADMDNKHNKKTDYKEYETTTRVVQLNDQTRGEAVSENPEYGKIVCRCEGISLAEVKEAIHGNVGTDNIVGLKKRVRCGTGRCQGGFCTPELTKIIAKEKNIDELDVLYNRKGSNILLGRSKEDL